jgi:hypothetical protein
VSGLTIAVACAAGGVATSSGCYTHQCDQSQYSICPVACNPEAGPVSSFCPDPAGGQPCAGFDDGITIFDQNIWESNRLNDPWLKYNGNTTVRLVWPPWFQGRTPFLVNEYVGAASEDGGPDQPNEGQGFIGGNNWALSAGQLGFNFFFDSNGISIYNATCGNYSLRVVVTFCPPGQNACDDAAAGNGAPPGDAGAVGVVSAADARMD